MHVIQKESFSWNFLKEMCKIIGEFIETKDLEHNTDKLKKIIVKFDDSKQRFVKEMMSPKNEVEREDFCRKMLYKIRYIFSKLGRLLNLHENPLINKWIGKDYKKLVKAVTKVNKKGIEELASKNIKLIHIDGHKNGNGKVAMMMFFKECIRKWRKDLDYAHLQKNQTATIT